jgi:hypothetical protein
MLNMYMYIYLFIYRQLSPKCFGVCYTTFREAIALHAQTVYAICDVANLISNCRNTKYKLLKTNAAIKIHVATSMQFLSK